MGLYYPPMFWFVAIVRNNVIGAVVSVRKGSNLPIISLAVKATYRNYGVGSSLLQKLKEKSQKNNLKEIHLHISSILSNDFPDNMCRRAMLMLSGFMNEKAL